MELLKDIITNTTVNLKSAELRDIQSHVTTLASKRLEDEKNAKKPQQAKKCKKKNEFNNFLAKLKVEHSEKDVDPFQLDKIKSTEEEFDGDDDFM
jgi:uncharacterized protein YlxW (UPF0749 family)